jgi:CRISPR/Cas system-associated exonuclease Cas4 (RecB family)
MHALVTSDKASVRLARAREVLAQCSTTRAATIIAPSADAASELVRSLERPSFGWRRLTLFRLAAELARPRLLELERSLATPLALEAVWARVVFTLGKAGQLDRLAPLVDRPGLSRALAQTIGEARALGLSPSSFEPAIAAAMGVFEQELHQAGLVDRAEVFELATQVALEAQPVVLLDVCPAAGVEEAFVASLAAAASELVAVAPSADTEGVARLARALKVAAEVISDDTPTPLTALQQNLFSSNRRAVETHAFSDVFSAPGEARECVEIVRRVLEASRQGTPLDRMAVLLRSPATYRAPLEDAFRRARVPAYFSTGMTRPEASGRALLALLRCAEDGLSARRFSEYLSLGQVPQATLEGKPPPEVSAAKRFERSEADTSLLPADDKVPFAEEPSDENAELDPDAPVTAGRLRSPRRWEQLIIDAAVIGGVDRWRRRLEGLEHSRRVALENPSNSEANQRRLESELAELGALKTFALPLLDVLAAFPKAATWGQWLEVLTGLASRALRFPRRVHAVLAELKPMADIGPVELREVRAVLTERLSEATVAPEGRRYGQVFVAPVEQAKGLSFELVFVPGLAERIFPQKVREDPLLPDAKRRALDERLETNDQRVMRERLALQSAVGAASVRAVLSWPRIDAEHARPRVPSFYALEAARAIEGRLPAYEDLQRRAEQTGQARLAWPAPQVASTAIDDTEYDLSVLGGILSSTNDVKGRARYLVEVSPHLGRALRARYARWAQSSWSYADGLVKPGAAGQAVMAKHQLQARPFSPTALEQYAACPYKFYLSAVMRLRPLEIPEAIEELGPLEKGSMTHSVQYHLLSRLRDQGVVVTDDTLNSVVFPKLDEVIAEVTAKFADDFVPAIDRVWKDGVEVMRADLRQWLRMVAADGAWKPWKFELSFGLANRDESDPSSNPEPVQLDHGLTVRGSIDLVEKGPLEALRATDYKTGKARAEAGNVVGGGRHLQPVLYALVLEKLFAAQRVEGGQLFYVTQVGGFSIVESKLDTYAREQFGRVVRAIRGALEQSFLPAMPDEGECRWCDYRTVCGPEEERRLRVTRKALRAETKELREIRELK